MAGDVDLEHVRVVEEVAGFGAELAAAGEDVDIEGEGGAAALQGDWLRLRDDIS